MFDYAGCIHFHSSYSYDGSQPVDHIVDSGLRTGLDYAILTDHFNLDAKKAGWERYHESSKHKMMLLVGEEVSPRYNHYLALNIPEPLVVSKIEMHSQDVIDWVNEKGGFGFIAHPDHAGAPFVSIRAYPWVDWNAKGFAGISIWDLMGDWSSGLTSPWGVFKMLCSNTAMLKGPRTETLRRWDELAQTQHCVAIGEIDNHATRKKVLGIPKVLFPFDFAFRTIRTHILLPEALTGTFDLDRIRMLNALRKGNSYVSFDLWNDPKGFRFEVCDATRRIGMGEEVVRQGTTLVEIKLPSPGRIKLIRNGRIIREEGPRSYMERDVDVPGVYRVQIDQKVCGRWRPWIFSNPIWVK